jgi:hypothetical protein
VTKHRLDLRSFEQKVGADFDGKDLQIPQQWVFLELSSRYMWDEAMLETNLDAISTILFVWA